MRAIWSGTIAFGLISIPVKLYSAVGREDDVSLHLLHEKDGEPIHYDRVCEKGHKVDWEDIVRGYEYQKGKWVTFTDDELKNIGTESMRVVDVVQFCPEEEIDPVYYDKPYYVAAEQSGAKAYKLFVDALSSEGLVGVAKVAIRDKEHLAAIRVEEGEIVLHTMHWPDEIRERSYKKPSGRIEVRDNERKMARQLVQQLSGEFDPDQFSDEYHEALKAAARKKVKGQDIVEPEGREEPAAVGDLMDALKRSVEAVRSGKSPREAAQKEAAKAAKAAAKKAGGNGKADLKSLSKKELLDIAAGLDVDGRSSMDKTELVKAISKAQRAA